MNTTVAGVRSAESMETPAGFTTTDDDHRVDVTGLPASQVTEYLQAWEDGDVFFERRAGKTFAVSGTKAIHR